MEGYYHKSAIAKLEAHIKEQAEEINELQEENNSLSVSIRKVTDERDKFSSLLGEAVEALDNWNRSFKNTMDYQKYECNIFDMLNNRFIETEAVLKKLEQFTKEQK